MVKVVKHGEGETHLLWLALQPAARQCPWWSPSLRSGRRRTVVFRWQPLAGWRWAKEKKCPNHWLASYSSYTLLLVVGTLQEGKRHKKHMSHMKTTTPFLPDCQSWWPLQPGLDFLASCWGLIWASLVMKALAYHYLFNVERWYQCLQRASHPKKVVILTLFWQLSWLKVEIWHWNAHHVNVCCFCSTDCSYSGTYHVRCFWQRAAGARSFDDLMLIFFTRTYSGKWFQCVSMSWTFSTGCGCPGMFSILEFETCGSARPEHAETKVLDIVWNMCLLVLCSTEAIGSIPHWWQNYFEHWIKTIGIGVHFISRLMQRLVSTGRWQKLSQWVIQWVWQFSQHFDSILIISPILSTSFYHPFLSISIQRIQSPSWPPERLDGILVDRLVELKYTGNVRGSALHFEIRQRLRFNDWKRIIIWRIDILYHIISYCIILYHIISH